MKFVLKGIKTLTIMFTLTIMAGIETNVSAADLTLDDCIELALHNRASIAVRGNEKRAKANQLSALGAFLPRISASYGKSESKTTNFIRTASINGIEIVDSLADTEGKSSGWNLQGSMWLINPSTWFNYFGAKADKESSHLNVLNSEQELIYAVKISYYAYLAAIENISVQQEAVKRSREQLKLNQSKFDLGSASKSDVLKQKVRYGNDRLALLSAENLVVTTNARLAYTIGMDPNSDLTFSTDYTVREYSGTLDEAISFAMSHEPGLLSAEKSVTAQNHAVKSRVFDYLPKLSGSASYGFGDGTRGDTILFTTSQNSRTFGISLNWTIFDGFNRENNLANAKINRNNARANLSDSKNAVVRDIKVAYLEIDRLKETKLVSNENVEAASEDLKITQEKYNLGSATILDLLNVQVSLKEAQQSLIKSEFDLNLAIAQLENAMGKM